MIFLVALFLAPNAAAPDEVKPPKVGTWSAYTMSDARGRPNRWLRFAVVGGENDGSRRFEIEVKGTNLAQAVLIAYDVDKAGALTRLVLQPGENAAPIGLPVEKGKALVSAREGQKGQKGQKARLAKLGQRNVRTPVGVIPCRSFRSDRGVGCVSQKVQPLGLVELVTAAGERFQLVGRGADAVPRVTRAVKTLPPHLLGTVDLPFLPAAP